MNFDASNYGKYLHKRQEMKQPRILLTPKWEDIH